MERRAPIRSVEASEGAFRAQLGSGLESDLGWLAQRIDLIRGHGSDFSSLARCVNAAQDSPSL